MKKNYEELGIEFQQTQYNLYVVYDKTTSRDISGIMTASNDLVAVGSFVEFLEKEKDKIKPYSEYVLRAVGTFDCFNLKLTDGTPEDILSSKEDVKEYYDGLLNFYDKTHQE